MASFPNLTDAPLVAIDTETTGLKWKTDKLFGVTLAVPGKSWYWDVRNKPGVISWLNDTCKTWKRIVNHGIKFDCHFLREAGVSLPLERVECTIVRECLIDENRFRYDLDDVANSHLGKRKRLDTYQRLAELFGGNPTRDAQMKNLHRAPESLVREYALPDSELALELWQWQEEEIARQELGQIWDLERRVTPVLIRMERRGVPVDIELTERLAKELRQKIRTLQFELNRITGKDGFNVNSPPQVRDALKPEKDAHGVWRLRDGTILEQTDGGLPSVNADALRRSKIPIASKILEMRKITKLVGTFLEGHILGHAVQGRVYANFNQTRGDNDLGTRTGRLSVDDPALQQIPSRDEGAASYASQSG